jgi:NAD(P)-dependent dehydrogenase (short-subunit alcohol dehydrogenase family)
MTTSSTDAPVAIVTAASKGIGAACARELAARGWKVALLARSDAVRAVAEELGGVAVQSDVTDTKSLDALVGEALAEWGRIDGAVINSGHAKRAPLLEITDEEWATGFELLFMTTVRLVNRLAPEMIKRGKGSIVTVSTAWAQAPNLRYPVSSPMRAGLGAYVKLASDELASKGVRVNALLPGFIDSQNHDAALIETVPMKRVGSVEEFAKVAAWLLSDESSYVTGQRWRVAGGVI